MSDQPDPLLETLRLRRDAPLVKFVDGYFEFYVDGEMFYDFKPVDAGQALRWIEHMTMKTWVTKEHIGLFATLAANQFGVGHT